MTFETMWPLGLLVAIPIILILYLLKPRGKDYEISSNLLWRKLFKNQESKTIFEKFVHNILMYLQILIAACLVLALMSPYLKKAGAGRGNYILVLDTSASMQHETGEGISRMEQAVAQAKELVRAAEGSTFSVISADRLGSNLLVAGSTDAGRTMEAIESIRTHDVAEDLEGAESLVDSLRGADEKNGTKVVVLTDGNGCASAEGMSSYFDADILVVGDAVDNLALNDVSVTVDAENDSQSVIAASVTNYGASDVTFETSLYVDDKPVELQTQSLKAKETDFVYFAPVSRSNNPVRCELSAIRFADGQKDSLETDNLAYGMAETQADVEAVLLGKGNTYLEKAYQAATGKTILRLTDQDASVGDEKVIRIYDSNVEVSADDSSRMLFQGKEHANGTQEHLLLSASACDLTAGIEQMTVGVNETYTYELPESAIGFLWAGDKCAAYYWEHEGRKEIVLGFDIRESDFPLNAQFPVFIANALQFLGDQSLLAAHEYEAGEELLFHPKADVEIDPLRKVTDQAGTYRIQEGNYDESYIVNFPTASQSDGQIKAEGSVSDTDFSGGVVKRQLRNLLILVLLLLYVTEFVIYVRQLRYRGRFYYVIRGIGIALLVLALLGVSIPARNGDDTTIFLVDISKSNESNLVQMERDLSDMIAKMPKKHEYGIITYGKNSLVEQFLTKDVRRISVMSAPDQSATNYEEAVSKALAMIPGGSAGQLVVLTDGRETKGDITSTVSALTSRQIGLYAKLYNTMSGEDVFIDRVELPDYLYQGDSYRMNVRVESNYDTDAVIEILDGGKQTDAYEVHLNKGENEFRLERTVQQEEMENFTVRVQAAGDSCEENNEYHAYAAVDTAPKVLLLADGSEDTAEYRKLLEIAGINYEMRTPENAPDDLDSLLKYQSVVLDNVFLSDLPEDFLAQIDTYVKDYGNGLICCGGDQSFALGGYRDSVLEKVLPVEMQLRGVDEVPTTAMIMVIDHSGSMSTEAGPGVTCLDLAVQAAEVAVDEMRSSDYVGVIAFDDRYHWVVEPTRCEDKDAIRQAIETIGEGGGTTIKPAVKAAMDGMSGIDADIYHVILLTDGQGETMNYKDVIEQSRERKITLSTVAMGDGADGSLLKNLAEDCGGRYYFTSEGTDIPKIFAQEVFLSGDTYLQDGAFSLAVNDHNELVHELYEDGWPIIRGYVSATPKSSAKVVIASDKDDPILTTMQYGLGHTVAWNTDISNRWTGGLAGSDDYVKLWKRILSYSCGGQGIGEDSVNVTTAGGYTEIEYQALDYQKHTKVEAVYTDPGGQTNHVLLDAKAPGKFQTKLETDMTGVYNLSVRRLEDDEITHAMTTAAVVQYSDEYKFSITNERFRSFIDQYGRMLDSDTNLWKHRRSMEHQRYPLAVPLLLLALLLFVLDVAVRRFHFIPQESRLYQAFSNWKNAQSAKTKNQQELSIRENVGTSEPETEEPNKLPADVRPAKIKKDKKNKKDKKDKKESQSLDTSALLKKKNLR